MCSESDETLSEDDAYEIALNDHPEYRDALDADELPDEIVGEDGEVMNPRLHLSLHAIVERQVASDDPTGVAGIARELEGLGLSRHEVRHRIALAVSDQMLKIMSGEGSFDEKRYMRDLRDMVRSLKEKRR